MVETQLTMPPDGAFALTARLFVASVLRIMGTEESSIEDFKLAVSELCAAAAGGDHVRPFTIRVTDEGERAVVEFEGVSTLEAGGPSNDEAEEFARAHRVRLLRSLFPQMQVADGIVRIADAVR